MDNEIQGSCITNSEIIQNNGYLFIYGDSHDAKGKKKKVIVDPGKDDNKKDDNSGNEQDKPCPCEDEKAPCDTCKSLVAYSRIVNATYANGGIHK